MRRFAFWLDLGVVLVLAAGGRRSHDLDGSVLGVLETAWPFLVGLAVGWVAVARQPRTRRVWWLDGTVVTLSTVVVGMLLRLASGQGAAAAFVLVATAVLAAGMLGWRAVDAALEVRRGR
ncbi:MULTISPECIES: DUF3054 domain-containing protein [Ornithinimicrobium]|jgi:undecaprenyl pyrophosphate phosphatase UppP|uniref:DUF3054 domain-containing protein n=1 Tax=Ornithinimicrobium kibberense TaxID=282060 RepID=A0ABV5V4H6_9MICO|nr:MULTISPECIES: DUF3054 domain-containing protein [Ornithinimicrobium]OLT22519.1 hypothetical protein BJF81_01670 [Ornithinimicrobium sp. CNJ-824]